MSTEQQREHFESVARKYFEARQDPKHLLLKEELWTYFFSNIHKDYSSVGNVLEPMCGHAEGVDILSKYLPKGTVYEAFDFSRQMVDFARERHPDVEIWEQDVTKFNKADSYDVVILIGGLHHVHAHAQDVLDRVSSSLKPGGLFINFEPTNNNIFFKFVRDVIYLKNAFFDNETEKGFTTAELDSMAKQSGLEIDFQIFPGLLAYILWYNPDAFPMLNIGSCRSVEQLLKFEKKIWKTSFAKFFSFATLSCYKKK